MSGAFFTLQGVGKVPSSSSGCLPLIIDSVEDSLRFQISFKYLERKLLELSIGGRGLSYELVFVKEKIGTRGKFVAEDQNLTVGSKLSSCHPKACVV
jgi:hypothetical protein